MTKAQQRANTAVVLDFETTGMSPQQGDRAIEIGAVKLVDGKIVDRFQSLMNPGCRISWFIENYTGISNEMVADAPPCAEVMTDFASFIDGLPLVAHNASFDRRFLDAEFGLVGLVPAGPFACTMLVARRLYQEAANHKLGTLVAYKSLPTEGTYHRALADAEMCAHLWCASLSDLEQDYGIVEPRFVQLIQLGKQSKVTAQSWLHKQARLSLCQR